MSAMPLIKACRCQAPTPRGMRKGRLRVCSRCYRYQAISAASDTDHVLVEIQALEMIELPRAVLFEQLVNLAHHLHDSRRAMWRTLDGLDKAREVIDEALGAYVEGAL